MRDTLGRALHELFEARRSMSESDRVLFLDEHLDKVRTAIAAAGGGVPQAWISLEEQRPEPEVFVLAWDGKKVTVDWWGSLYRPHGTEYTHWMPFPSPPGVSGRSMYGMHSIASSPQPEAEQEQPEKCGNRDYCGRFPFCGCGGPEPLPERDTSKPAEQQGLFRKFDVRRTDGSDKPGGKHYGCEYFVLDVAHDKHAKAALAAYAAAVEETNPHLAQDMWDRYELSTPAQPEAAPALAQVPLCEVCYRENGVVDACRCRPTHHRQDVAPEAPAQAAPSAGEVERDRWRDREYEAWHRGFVERCGDEPVPREAWRAALSHKEQP